MNGPNTPSVRGGCGRKVARKLFFVKCEEFPVGSPQTWTQSFRRLRSDCSPTPRGSRGPRGPPECLVPRGVLRVVQLLPGRPQKDFQVRVDMGGRRRLTLTKRSTNVPTLARGFRGLFVCLPTEAVLPCRLYQQKQSCRADFTNRSSPAVPSLSHPPPPFRLGIWCARTVGAVTEISPPPPNPFHCDYLVTCPSEASCVLLFSDNQHHPPPHRHPPPHPHFPSPHSLA